MYELARKYGLQLPHSVVLEGLVSLCKKSKDHIWRGSQQELANYVLCGRMVAGRSLKFLEEKGIILKRAGGYMLAQNEQVNAQNEQKNAQNEQKEERSKEEKINKKESSVSKDATTTQTPFSEFWNLASPNGEWKSYKAASIKTWRTMPEDWRKLAIERVVNKPAERNAYYYLVDEDFRKESPAAPGSKNADRKKSSPEWLVGTAIDDALKDGKKLCVCKNPETDLFGTLEKSQAEQFGFEIDHDM